MPNQCVQDPRDRLCDELCSKIEPLIPVSVSKHPLGCHRLGVCNRRAMDTLLFVLRIGCQWNAFNQTLYTAVFRKKPAMCYSLGFRQHVFKVKAEENLMYPETAARFRKCAAKEKPFWRKA